MSSPFHAGERFGDFLRMMREMRGLTQSELGARAGLGAASISHFETGQRLPSLDSLVKIADALECSVDALLGRATMDETAHVDPIFLRASRSNAQTLENVRRVTAALLAAAEENQSK